MSGLAIAGIGVWKIVDVSAIAQDASSEYADVSVGVGLYMTVGAGVLLFAAALTLIQKAMSRPNGPAEWTPRTGPQWSKDPFRRFAHRWWNGVERTDRVSRDGAEYTDPAVHVVPEDHNGWADDPFGRFAKRRYREGEWTDMVADSPDSVLDDPPGYPAPIPPPPDR